MSLRYGLELHDPGMHIGAYRVIDVIGYGGFGAVYFAEDTRTNKRVALKQSFDPRNIRTFQSEFTVLHRLSHDHLPHYYEMFEEQGNGYLVMEVIPGLSLFDVFKKRKHQPLAEAQVMGYAVQVCNVLAYLHSQDPPLIHRDIKPDNIRLTPEGLIKLVDFGLLKQGTGATRSSRMGLTLAYAPLEQWGETNVHTSPQSDIYSLGATFYHLLTGQPPVVVTDRVTAGTDPLLPPNQLNPRISTHMSDALVKALAIHPQNRFEDAVAFEHALVGIIPQPVLPPTTPVNAPLKATSPVRTRRVTDPAKMSLFRTLEGHTGNVRSVAWSPDGTTLASGSRDETVKLWNKDGTLLRTLEGHTHWVRSVAWSPDGTTLASGSWDNTVKLWNKDGTLLRTLEGHTHWVLSVTWSPDGTTLASGSYDKTVKLWNKDGTLLRTLEGHTHWVLSVAWSPDGTTLASGSYKEVKLWNKDATLLRTLEGHSNDVWSVAWSPDGTTLASGSEDGTIRLWR
jgi:serine/threonine protein kinase